MIRLAGIPVAWFQHFVARQVQSMICWAACIQLVLNCHGLRATQLDAVVKLYGAPWDLPANAAQMAAELNFDTYDHAGRCVRVMADASPVSGDQLVRELTDGNPVIVIITTGGFIGHALVLFSQELRHDNMSNPHLMAILADPSPSAPPIVELPWMQFVQAVRGVVRIHVVR